VYSSLFNSCVKFKCHLKIARTAELSTKVVRGSFYVHPVYLTVKTQKCWV